MFHITFIFIFLITSCHRATTKPAVVLTAQPVIFSLDELVHETYKIYRLGARGYFISRANFKEDTLSYDNSGNEVGVYAISEQNGVIVLFNVTPIRGIADTCLLVVYNTKDGEKVTTIMGFVSSKGKKVMVLWTDKTYFSAIPDHGFFKDPIEAVIELRNLYGDGAILNHIETKLLFGENNMVLDVNKQFIVTNSSVSDSINHSIQKGLMVWLGISKL